MKYIVAALMLGTVVAVVLQERGPGLTPAQVLTTLAGVAAGGVIAACRRRRIR